MARYCHNCGAQVSVASARFCSECGAQLVTASPSGPQGFGTGEKKNPLLALLCSTILPGLGQVYDGSLAKGFAIFFGAFIGLFLLFIPGAIFWVYGIHDAYSTANKMNEGKIPVRPAKVLHLVVFIIIAAAIVAVAIAVIYYIVLPSLTDLFSQQMGLGNTNLNNLFNY